MSTGHHSVKRLAYGYGYRWEVVDEYDRLVASWIGWSRTKEKAEEICLRRIHFFTSIGTDRGDL